MRTAIACLLAAPFIVACDRAEREPASPGPLLEFSNAWIRAPIAGRPVTAAYGDVTNQGDRTVVITGFTSDLATLRVEIHETTEDGGMMRMRPLKRVTIPAGTTVSFAPGGKHLMLFGFDAAASQAMLHVTFEGGERLPVVFAIRPEAEQ